MSEHAPPHTAQMPLDRSISNQIRVTHRLFQSVLQTRIKHHGVTLGMWYFLRTLWDQDGLTQSALSRRVGTTEPTTLAAVLSMERVGLVHRTRHERDKRKIRISLTEKGRALQSELLSMATDVENCSLRGLTCREVDLLLHLLYAIQDNLQKDFIGN